MMTKSKLSYNNGIIYKILDNRTQALVYIGCTCQQLSQRMATHRSTSKTGTSKLYKYLRNEGIGFFSIHNLELFPCKTSNELEDRETYWLQKLQPEYNTNKKESFPTVYAKVQICSCGHSVDQRSLTVHYWNGPHNREMDKDPERCIRYLFSGYPTKETLTWDNV
jgi:hypothetical protein